MESIKKCRKRARESSSSDRGRRNRAGSSDSDLQEGGAQSSDDEGGAAKVASKLGLEVNFLITIVSTEMSKLVIHIHL